jgi:ankyrin repeat protein
LLSLQIPPAASSATIAEIITETVDDADSEPPRTTLVSLPNEILLQIASRLHERDLNSLSRINSRLYILLTHLLYRLGKEIEYHDLSTLLHWACTRSLTKTVHHLLEQSANPNAKYYRAYHPLQSDGRTPLHICAETGNRRIAKLLLAHGAKTKSWDKEGNSPLHLAVKYGKRGMVKVLVKSGAKITARNTDGLRPLHVAILEDQKQLVKLLIDLGADVNAKDRTYGTALHLAASFESSGICEKLIQAGADVNDKDIAGMTPLHWAAYTGYVQTARLLVKHGAGIDERDRDGKLPLHWAGIGSNKEVWGYLSVFASSIGQLSDNDGLEPELKGNGTSTTGNQGSIVSLGGDARDDAREGARDESDSVEEETEVVW